MAIETLQHAGASATGIGQDPAHLGKGGPAVGEEHQSRLTQHQIEAAIWERELLHPAFAPFDGNALP